MKKHALSLAEGSRQQRPQPFVVLTYYAYALRAKGPAALPVEGRAWVGRVRQRAFLKIPFSFWRLRVLVSYHQSGNRFFIFRRPSP